MTRLTYSYYRRLKLDDQLDVPVSMRIGVSSGGLVTGVTGKLCPTFCVFGNALNEAVAMEKEGSAGFIHVSRDFAEFLDKYALLSELSSLYTLEKRRSMSMSMSMNMSMNMRTSMSVMGNNESYWLKAGPMLNLKSRFACCYMKEHEVAASGRDYEGYASEV
jgi:hypothetical protein